MTTRRPRSRDPRPCTRRDRARRRRRSPPATAPNAGIDRRLCEVVDDDRTSGRRRQSQGSRQLPRSDQEVIGKTGGACGADPVDDIVSEEPLGIRFVVDLVADADEMLAIRRGTEGGDRVGHAGICEIGPSDHAPMNGCRAASRRKSYVSSRLERVCTRIVPSTPVASSSGSRSAGPNARRMTARSSVSHG